MLAISKSEVDKLYGKATAAIRKARAVQDRAKEAVSKVVTTSEVSAAAFLLGLSQGKWGSIVVIGVPVDLLAGLGLHLAGFAGVAGGQSSHLHAFGDGALASFFSGLGFKVGQSMKTGTTSRGDMAGVTGGASLADDELARMVAAGR
jgi:hypothetical protein